LGSLQVFRNINALATKSAFLDLNCNKASARQSAWHQAVAE